jgi:hypothetical protein
VSAAEAGGTRAGGRPAPAALPPASRAVGAAAIRAGALSRATETLALTLWAEAGDRPVRAVEALAALVANRARPAAADPAARLRFAPGAPPTRPGDAGVWPLLLGHVCRAPFLFDCWNPRHARHPALAAGAAPAGDPALAVCRRVAARAAAGTLPDPTGGATHWHAAEVLPPWARGRMPVGEMCGLVLYRP